MQEIHYAAARGDLETVQEELNNGVDPNYIEPPEADSSIPEYSPLMYAAQDPRAGCDMLGLLLGHGADLHLEFKSNTALRSAIRGGQLEKVKFLVNKGADIHYVTKDGVNAWLDAIDWRSESIEEIIDWLLEIQCSNINQISKGGGDVCSALSSLGEFGIIKKVVDAGACREPLKWTDLMWEIVYGTVESVRKALPGADLRIGDSCGRDAWMLSGLVGSIEKSAALLEFGAERLTMDRKGHDILHLAVRANHSKFVTWLLDIGMDFNHGNYIGKTALMEAASYGSIDSMKALLDYGADPSVEDRTWERAISYASNLECVKLLVERGEDMEFNPSGGHHLLESATLNNDIQFISDLLKAGINPDLNHNSETTLHMAIFGDKLEIAKLLLDAGANPNQEDYDGERPFHHCESRKAIDLLLEYGADPNCECWGGDTPDMKYERFERPDLAKYFRRIRDGVNC